MTFNLDVWKLLAGLGIFLFGMLLIEESVRALSGRAFRRIIRQYTDGRLKSIGSGALVKALLQSSSAVSLMVLAFVGAGVMNMQNAVGVIMGSNIGTTLTAWIIATIGFKIKIESLALPFIGLLPRLLIKIYPDHRTILTVYLDQTPPEVTDAASSALRKETGYLPSHAGCKYMA